MGMIYSTGLEIRAKLEKLQLLSSFIGNTMLKFELSEYQQFQMQIAIEEAIKNVIVGSNLEENDKISIKCQRHDNQIKIIVEYPGKSFNPIKIENKSLNQNSGNLKVYFIRKNMDKVDHEFVDAENILTMTKSI